MLYHLTAKVDFRLDPKKRPNLNTTMGGDLKPGIFLTDQPEHWANGYGYWQPWIVEFEVPGDLNSLDGVIKGGYGNEVYVPAEHYNRLRIVRVMPLDGYCREEYQDWGWTEDEFRTDYDTGEALPDTAFRRPSNWPGYRAPDARQWPRDKQDAYKKRVSSFRRKRGRGAYASLTAMAFDMKGPGAKILPEGQANDLREFTEMMEAKGHLFEPWRVGKWSSDSMYQQAYCRCVNCETNFEGGGFRSGPYAGFKVRSNGWRSLDEYMGGCIAKPLVLYRGMAVPLDVVQGKTAEQVIAVLQKGRGPRAAIFGDEGRPGLGKSWSSDKRVADEYAVTRPMFGVEWAEKYPERANPDAPEITGIRITVHFRRLWQRKNYKPAPFVVLDGFEHEAETFFDRKEKIEVQSVEVWTGDSWKRLPQGAPFMSVAKVAMPSWRDRGDLPQADCVIQPDLGRSRFNSYGVYTYGEMVARFPTLGQAKGYIEDVYGPQQWVKVPGDQVPKHDRVWGFTTEFNDAPFYLVVEHLPRLGKVASDEGITYAVSYRKDPEGEPAEGGIAWVVAKDGDRVVGALQWNYDADPPYVADMSVEPEYRRRGIGTTLFEMAKASESRLEHSQTLTPDGQQFVRSFGALSLEAVISVAEEAMERGGQQGQTLYLPVGHADDPAYREAIAPIERWASEVVGESMVRRIYTSEYTLAQAGNPQAMVTAMGSIVTRPVTNEMTVLHEAAHLITRTQHGRGGHTMEFAETARDLYARYISAEAADIFWNLVSSHPASRTASFFMHDADEPLIDTKPMEGFEEKASFDFFHPQIATGGALRFKSDMRILARRGVKGVVSGRRDFDDNLLLEGQQNLGIRVLSLPVPDNGVGKPTSWFKAAIDFCLPILRSGGKVYIHCHAGMNRGPSLAYAVYRAYTGAGHQDAFDLIKRCRDVALIGYADDADKALVELGYAKDRADVDTGTFHTITGAKQPLVPGHAISWTETQASCSCGASFPVRDSAVDAYLDALRHIGPDNPDRDEEEINERERRMHNPPPPPPKVRPQRWVEPEWVLTANRVSSIPRAGTLEVDGGRDDRDHAHDRGAQGRGGTQGGRVRVSLGSPAGRVSDWRPVRRVYDGRGVSGRARPLTPARSFNGDLKNLDPKIKKLVLDLYVRLGEGRVSLEIKANPPLDGTFTIDVMDEGRDTGYRIGCYLTSYDDSWVVYWCGPHNYDEAEKRIAPQAKVATPNRVEVFSGTGEKNYANNKPYVVVAMDSPMGSDPMAPNEIKVPIPWDSDLRTSIRKAEDLAERFYREEPYSRWAAKGTGFYLFFGSQKTSRAAGQAKRMGDAWQPAHGKIGYAEAWPEILRLLDRPKDAFAAFCKEIADSQPPGFNLHPLLPKGTDIVTIYRGISLAPGQDPTTVDKGSDGGMGSGVGGSWTLDLGTAKAIAERGQAGFTGENNVFGKPRTIKAIPLQGSNGSRGRAVVLRAEVDLSKPGFALLSDGRMYYASEQEVDLATGTLFTMTGWMEAEQVPVNPAEMRKAIEKAKGDIARNGYSLEDYDITYRWPSSWHTTHIQRTAAAKTITLYHGTNEAALEAIQQGGFKAAEHHLLANQIEQRYGLPHDSVWTHPRYSFNAGFRRGDQKVYLTGEYRTAEEYARIGSEAVNDALNTVWVIQHQAEIDALDGNYPKPGPVEWVREQTREHYRPVVLTVDVPEDVFRRDYPQGDLGDFTGHTTVALTAPLPSSLIRSIKPVTASKTAMPVGPPPPGVRYLATGNSRQGLDRSYSMLGAFLGDDLIGYLTWGIQGRKVQSLWVDPAYRRRRIAETMFSLAREVDPGIIHHPDRTDAGNAWVNFTSPGTPERENNTTEDDYDRTGRFEGKGIKDRLLTTDPRDVGRVRDLTPMARAAAITPNTQPGATEQVTDRQYLCFHVVNGHRLDGVKEHGVAPGLDGAIHVWRTIQDATHYADGYAEPHIFQVWVPQGTTYYAGVNGDDRHWVLTGTGNLRSAEVPRFMWKEAGHNGDLPEGLVLTVEDGTERGEPSNKRFVIAQIDGKQVGWLGWFLDANGTRYGQVGEIFTVGVREEYRRRGIASAMLAMAREDTPGLRHSDALSDDGAAWARKMAADSADTEGVMVALVPPMGVCKALIEHEMATEPLENQHITLIYLGKKDAVSKEDLHEAVEKWASESQPISGKVAGYGTFVNDQGGVLYASWDLPGANGWREGLLATLRVKDIKVEENHGWTPHQTLAYTDEPITTLPPMPAGLPDEVIFGSVVVAYGGDWTSYSLLGDPPDV